MTSAEIAAMVAKSPLKASGTRALPGYFSIREVDFPDLFTGAVMTTPTVPDTEVQTLLSELGTKNHWTSPVPEIVNPTRATAPAPPTQARPTAASMWAMYDTSPYPADNPPEIEPYVKREKPQFIVTADRSAHGPPDRLPDPGGLTALRALPCGACSAHLEQLLVKAAPARAPGAAWCRAAPGQSPAARRTTRWPGARRWPAVHRRPPSR